MTEIIINNKNIMVCGERYGRSQVNTDKRLSHKVCIKQLVNTVIHYCNFYKQNIEADLTIVYLHYFFFLINPDGCLVQT